MASEATNPAPAAEPLSAQVADAPAAPISAPVSEAPKTNGNGDGATSEKRDERREDKRDDRRDDRRSRDRSPSRSPSRDRSPRRRDSPRRERSPRRDGSPKRSRERDRSPRRSSDRDKERDHKPASSTSSRSRHSRYSDSDSDSYDRHHHSRDRDNSRRSDRRDDRDDRRKSPPRSSSSSAYNPAQSRSSAASAAAAPGPQSFGVVPGAFPYGGGYGGGGGSGGYPPQASYGNWPGANAGAAAAARGGPVQKNFYKAPASHNNFSEDQVREWWREHRIALQGRDAGAYKPCRTFEESNLAPEYLITTRTFAKPTPIQAQTWPVALSGRDMIGIAETGSGKTLSFALPACVHIRAQAPLSPSMPGPIALILAPTRELACQTQEVCDAVGKGLGIRSVCLYGGVGKGTQRGALQRGVHIAVATPGRLLDLINEGRCNISRVTYLVLDEADRMLDMGFEKDIRAIIERLRSDRQTLMFSATWPNEIQRLAHEFLQDPVKVTIGSPDLAANRKITQVVEVVHNPDDKDDRLDACLRKYHASGQNRILIFVGMKREADRVDRMLRNRYRWRSQAIHGDLDQNERTRVMAQFKAGTAPLLVATDVAARGLDIPDVEYVINYTFPMNIEDYIHRIGRTGRGGKDGFAHTFFTPADGAKARDLIEILRKANQRVPPELEEMQSYGRGRGRGGPGGRGPMGGGGGNRYGGGGGGYGSQQRGGYGGPSSATSSQAPRPAVAVASGAYGAPAAMPWAAYGQYPGYAAPPAGYAMYAMPYGMSAAGTAQPPK